VFKQLTRFARNPYVQTCLMVAVFRLGLAAADRVEKTFDTTPNPRISVSNLGGKVVVKGWDKGQVHAVYTTSSPRIQVETEVMPATGQAEKIHFSTQDLEPQANGTKTADYLLEIPVGSSLEVRDPQGSVEIEKLQGDIRAESVNAPLTLADTTGHVAARSIGGTIDVIRPAGRVEANSVNGNLHFVSPSTPELDGNTTTGAILYQGNFGQASDYRLRTYSGNIEVRCPSSVSLELRARTSHGKLENRIEWTSASSPFAPR